MPLNLSKPILYLITRGATIESTTSASPEVQDILLQVSSAVDAGIDLIQLREKNLTARVLFELTERAVEITRGTSTRLLVNDRSDVAAGAGADGVHLTTQSLDAATIRKTFGEDFLVGASTHSLAEASVAGRSGADFIVFGPIFPTRSKTPYGSPVGVESLAEVTRSLDRLPVLALGGISVSNVRDCFATGASGIAAISLFTDPKTLQGIAATIRDSAKGVA